MYSDAKKRFPRWIILVIVLALAAASMTWAATAGSSEKLSEEGAVAIRSAVQRSALQCYAVEGVYPPDLRYLEENYGLQVNTQDYYVTYDIFGSNVPPTVIVQAKN